MKNRIKLVLILVLVIFSFSLIGCDNGTGGGGTTEPVSLKLDIPTNLRTVEYEESLILFFSIVDNANEYQVNIYKNDSFFKRITINSSEAIAGVNLGELEEGTYDVAVRAMVETGSKFINSDSSAKLNIVITATGGSDNTGGDNTGGDNTGGNDDPVITDYISYYDNAEGLTGTALKSSLRTIISVVPRPTSYEDLKEDLQYTDADPNDSSKIVLFYSRVSINKAWVSGGATWNREHVWPKSLGWYNESGAGSDIHHIRPTDPTVNSTRGNKSFANVTNGTAIKYNGVTAGYYWGSNNNGNFEPIDEVKGDVARIIMYMLVRYSQTDSSYPLTKIFPSYGVLLQWHLEDPVDELEKIRNERSFEIQGNRNPFIDYPQFAEMIWS